LNFSWNSLGDAQSNWYPTVMLLVVSRFPVYSDPSTRSISLSEISDPKSSRPVTYRVRYPSIRFSIYAPSICRASLGRELLLPALFVSTNSYMASFSFQSQFHTLTAFQLFLCKFCSNTCCFSAVIFNRHNDCVCRISLISIIIR